MDARTRIADGKFPPGRGRSCARLEEFHDDIVQMTRIQPRLDSPLDRVPVLDQLLGADAVLPDDFPKGVPEVVTQKNNVVRIRIRPRERLCLCRHYRRPPIFQSTTIALFADCCFSSSSARSSSSTSKTLIRGDVPARDFLTQPIFSASHGTCIIQSPAVGFQFRESTFWPSSIASIPYLQ